MKRFFAAVLICVVFWLGCTPVRNTAPVSALTEGKEGAVSPEARLQEIPPYRINVGDILEVSVWRAKGMDAPKEVIVRPDGVISYPLVGDIKAVGLTLTEFDHEVTRALRVYIRNPEVSIAIRRFGGTKVIVLGEVKAAGVYSPTGQGSVLEVIALAGGFTDDAVKADTILIRGGLQNPRPVRLNLAMALTRGDQRQNPPLMPNDIIYVPRNAAASFNYYMKQLTPTLSNLLLGATFARDIDAINKGTP